jgi:hypothetical protein
MWRSQSAGQVELQFIDWDSAHFSGGSLISRCASRIYAAHTWTAACDHRRGERRQVSPVDEMSTLISY